jgi:hypothetical protein
LTTDGTEDTHRVCRGRLPCDGPRQPRTWRNSQHEIFGQLFQGRYKAVVVEPEAGNYFAVVSTYVHLNPARAGLIRVGEEPLVCYRWKRNPQPCERLPQVLT